MNPDGSLGINLHYSLDEAVPVQIWDTDADGDGLSPYGEDLNADGVLNDGVTVTNGVTNPLLNEALAGIDFNGDGDSNDIFNEDVNNSGVLDSGDADDQAGWLRYQQLRQSNFGKETERNDPNATQILAAKAWCSATVCSATATCRVTSGWHWTPMVPA